MYALHSRLAQVFADAVHDGLVSKSPCSRRTTPSQWKQRPCVPTTEQMWALHDALPERLRAAVLLGAFAGLRDAEVCGLRVSDVHFMRGIISRSGRRRWRVTQPPSDFRASASSRYRCSGSVGERLKPSFS